MTKRYFFGIGILICLSIGQRLFSQPCVRNVSTNPNNPTNSFLTSPSSPNNGKINPWLNTFSLFTGSDPLPAIQLNPNAGWQIPAYTSGPFLMLNPYSPNHSSDFFRGLQFNATQLDRNWVDGWELLWINTGYYPNGEAQELPNLGRIIPGAQPLAHNQIPYIVQYNRYTGKLRVFAAVFTEIGGASIQDVRFIIGHENSMGIPVSGIFRHISAFDRAMDQPSKYFMASTFHSNVLNNSQWMVGEIQLGYDPCVCQFQSSINFKFHGISTSNVNLYGRSLSVPLPLQDANGPTYQNFLSNTSIGQTFSEGGSALFGSFEGMLNSYNDELNRYNSAIKQYNKPMNVMMRQLISTAKDAVVTAGVGFVPQVAISDFALRQLVKIGGAETSDTTTAKGFSKALTDGTKGALGKGFDMLSVTAFGEDFFKEPQRPSMPTATFQEMKITGTITHTTTANIGNLMTPGSYKYGSLLTASNYPAYDEAVGQYALLRTPSVKAFHSENALSISNIPRHTLGPHPNGPHSANIYDTIFHVVQKHEAILRLNKDLLYKLNRALDFNNDKTELHVSFEVEYENQDASLNNMPLYDPITNLYMESPDFYLLRATAPFNGRGITMEFSTKWINIDELSPKTFNLKFKEEFDYSSKIYYHPIPNYGPYSIESPNPKRGPVHLKIKRIKMKVAADMYFHQLGSNNIPINTFQVHTYLLYGEDEGVDLIGSHGVWATSVQKVAQFSDVDLTLTNEVIEPNDPFVTSVDGNVIFVGANNIQISGNLNVAPGYRAVLQAKFNIQSNPTSIISSDIVLENTQTFSHIDVSREATENELQQFCVQSQNGYRAKEPSLTSSSPDEQNDSTSTGEVVSPQSKLYPNPVNNICYIQSNYKEKTTYHFHLYDTYGRLLMSESRDGEQEPTFELSLGRFPVGTYYLKVITEDRAISNTHKVVLLKVY